MSRSELVAEEAPRLPPLAWHLRCPRRGSAVLLHGSSVQVRDGGFVEGCVAIDERGASKLREAFGTALVADADGWLVVTPSHTLESTYVYRDGDGCSVSNSLGFLAAHNRITLPWNPRYGAAMASLCLGIDDYESTLWATSAAELRRFSYDNIRIRADGSLAVERKPAPPKFETFRAYETYLLDVLRTSFTSANPRAYRPISTCSSGYDSTCVSALAKRLGCAEALTLRSARGGADDSGKQVGERLGISVHEFERTTVVDGELEDLASFTATGTGGEDYCFRRFAPLLHKRIFVTGFHGDKVWALDGGANTVLARGDMSGSSLQEFRLWHDFIHVPVPMIGARAHPGVEAISRSDEMSPFRIGTEYDRPIPRRIVEEAGIPREWFGQKKKAASLPFFADRTLMSAAGERGARASMPVEWVRAAHDRPARMLWALRFAASRALSRAEAWCPGEAWLQRKIVGDMRVFEHSRHECALDFLAGLEVVKKRYEACL